MDLKGSQTEKNLLAAFAGESQARTRYSFFASVARKEGYEQISGIFQETSDNEREHAQLFFNHLKGGMAEITASYPAGITLTTAANLKAAAEAQSLAVSLGGPEARKNDRALDSLLQDKAPPEDKGEAPETGAALQDDKIKVSITRLDHLVNVTGELVIAQLMVAERINATSGCLRVIPVMRTSLENINGFR
jgi:rubrerythrin